MTTKEKELEVHVVASGSKGNCTIIRSSHSAVIVDAGISCRRITNALQDLEIPKHMVEGIVITHEHSDHIAGVPQMIKQMGLPIITRPNTARRLMDKFSVSAECFQTLGTKEVTIGDMVLQPFSTSHDAVDPIGITCYKGQTKAALLTDTGMVSKEMLEHLHDTDLLVLEANYDEHMLLYGPYSPDLKRRVKSHAGHLCNMTAMKVLSALRRPKNMEVIFAHRSEQNNSLHLVEQLSERLLKWCKTQGQMGFTAYHGDPKEYTSIGISNHT
ncbi:MULTISPECIES: MBL fold metallo-hydrolase [unclassified Veillonella]|uniref:MBL fold metallo-hydrolase n=1 Tax=unclassified Veillonella TaxID=2630086 RepID=UPI000785D9ED|nr:MULTISPECIES: MBL fold metallo-hydrolase [unclassified Veillonella]KXB88592.1 metallo-beta-lactamase domain protein [Veillonella sp. DNF00869]